MQHIIKQYKKKAKLLKKNKLLSIDLRKKLTTQSKRIISYQYNKYIDVLNDDYVRRYVSPKKISLLKEYGYTTHNRHVWIPTLRNNRVKIKKQSIEYENNTLIENHLLIPNVEIFKRLHKVKLKENERITVRIGNNGVWELYDNPNKLLNYIVNVFTPNKLNNDEPECEMEKRKHKLISMMAIIKIKR